MGLEVKEEWMCNGCGERYPIRREAVECCPDIVRVEVEYYISRLGKEVEIDHKYEPERL